MKNVIKIGEKEYKSKKEALTHYKGILNAYSFGQSVNEDDLNDIINLLNYNLQYYLKNITSDSEVGLQFNNGQNEEVFVSDVKVVKVQYNTKCFEIFYSDDTSEYISYLMIIKGQEYTPEKLFSVSCRNVVQKDMLRVKQIFFKTNARYSRVKCQETGIESTWDELVVDHRQPNTLSVIIERFKEVYNLNPSELEYTSTVDNLIVFKDSTITNKFKSYHANKANLRIVRKDCNASRSSLARVKRNSKDLIVPDSNQLSLF